MIGEYSNFLLKVSKKFIRTRNFDSLIGKVLKTVKDDFGLTNCALLLYEKETDEIYVKNFIGFKKKDVKKWRIPVGEGITGKCAKTKKMIYVPDVSKEATYVKRYTPTKSELAIPLISERKFLGLLNFEKKEKNGFIEEEIKFLETFSSIVSIAFENALLFGDIRRKEKQKLELIEIARAASGTMKRESVFGKLVSLGGKLIDADQCVICLYDKKTGGIQAQLPGYGAPVEYIKKFHFNVKDKSVAAKVVKSGETYITNEAAQDPYIIKKFVQLFGVKRVMVSPLKISKEVIGLFYAAKVEGKEPFTEDDKNIILIFSSLSATIIKRMQIFNELNEKKKELKNMTRELKKTNEELQKISFAKTNLISNISHELRTPLVSIKGYTDLLISEKFGSLGGKQKLSLLAVKRNAERLINSIDNLLDISKIELGSPQKIVKELINLSSVLDETVELIIPKAKEKGIVIKKKYGLGHLIVEANREKLLRAFLNILDNAVKFNKKNGKILVKCFKENKSVVTEIKDAGIGIPEIYHRIIFNRFFQVESADKRGFSGAGIGLSLALEIIKFFNGDIQVKSKPDKGTSFIITLPAK